MKKKVDVRLSAQIVIALGITAVVFLGIISNSFVNASTTNVAYPTFSSVTMNLFVEGIEGESIISGRENSITVLGYSHSINNPFDLTTGQTTVVQHSPLRIMKSIDKSSPKLMEKCVTKVIIPSVILRFYYEPVGSNFYTIELTNALVTSYQGFGTTISNEVPRETVSFTYASIKWIYTEYDEMGNPKGNIEAQDDWDQTPPG